MYELFLSAIAGSSVGIICGMIPGVGMFVATAVLYALLMDFDPAALIMFYTCMVCSAQYFGSITAIYLGMPGEASSYPAVIEGYSLSKKGQGQKSIYLTGIGSFIGTGFGLFFIALLALGGMNIVLTSVERGILFLLVGASLVLTTNNKLRLDVSLIILAVFLCHIGYSGNSNIPRFYFDMLFLSQGVHFFPIAAGLLSMKEVLHAEDVKNKKIITEQNFKYLEEFIKHKYAIIRGSLIGGVAGMLPGLTTIASSHMAYLTEQKVQQKTYKKGNTYCITSSETANNAGSISQLFPLLMFGIPISGSEAIIWSLLDIKGWENSPNEVIKLVTEHWYILLAINLIALTLAIRFARHFIKIVPKNANLLKLIIFLILCAVTYTVGEKLQGYGNFSLFCFVLTTLIAWKTPKVSYIPFIFWMVIGPILLDSFYTALMVHGIYGA